MYVRKGMFTDRELELAGRSIKLSVETYFQTEELRSIVCIDIVPTLRAPDDNQVRLHIVDGCPRGYAEGALTSAIDGAKKHFGDGVPVRELPPPRHARERIID